MANFNVNGKAGAVLNTVGYYKTSPWEETPIAYYVWEKYWGQRGQLPAPNRWVQGYYVRYGAHEARVSYEEACAILRAVTA